VIVEHLLETLREAAVYDLSHLETVPFRSGYEGVSVWSLSGCPAVDEDRVTRDQAG
jgi:hypothetical protein